MEEQRQAAASNAHADGRLPLPRQTTPTWEVEMLLSAGLVFALFQVPEPLHRWSEIASARLGDAGDLFASMLLVYALMAIYALIATFLVHLTARAYWVAMVGIGSVYPDGIRWDKYAGGPIAKREMQRQIPSFPALVERADNMASLVFAFGLVIVMSSLLGAALALPAVAFAILLSETLLVGVPLHSLMGGLLLALLLPLMGIGVADKLLGRRTDGPPPPRWFQWLATRFQRLAINRLPAPLILMIATNQRGRRAYVLFFLSMALMMVLLVADVTLRRSGIGNMGYAFLPERQAQGAYPRHYRDQRGDALGDWNAPSIQSLVVEGDWLQLLVPYDPERHEPLLERDCAGGAAAAEALAADIGRDAGDAARLAAEERVLGCLAPRLGLSLDGVPIEAVDLAFSEDPGTGLPALLAMVDASGLAPGRHELALARLPSARELGDAERLRKLAQSGPVRIPFWR